MDPAHMGTVTPPGALLSVFVSPFPTPPTCPTNFTPFSCIDIFHLDKLVIVTYEEF